MVSPIKALVFLVFLVVLQQIEGNVIYPKVVGTSIGLPGIWVLAAVTIGGGVGAWWACCSACPWPRCSTPCSAGMCTSVWPARNKRTPGTASVPGVRFALLSPPACPAP
ncbi:MAG: AI-2E family transporter [Flavonifractor plautii]